jgi:hypothetical protein
MTVLDFYLSLELIYALFTRFQFHILLYIKKEVGKNKETVKSRFFVFLVGQIIS